MLREKREGMTSKLFTAPNTVTVANTMAEHGDSRDHRIEKQKVSFVHMSFLFVNDFVKNATPGDAFRA